MVQITELTGARAYVQSRILPLTRHGHQWLSSGSGECNEKLEFWRETKVKKNLNLWNRRKGNFSKTSIWCASLCSVMTPVIWVPGWKEARLIPSADSQRSWGFVLSPSQVWLWNGMLPNPWMTGINGTSWDGLEKVTYYITYLFSTIPQYEAFPSLLSI